MINFGDYTNKNKTEHNSKWPYIPDHRQIILIIGGSRSGKTNALLNLINNQPYIDKIYLYARDPRKAKYQFLINKRENTGLKHFNDLKAFIECQMICKMFTKMLKNTIWVKNRKILIVFDCTKFNSN